MSSDLKRIQRERRLRIRNDEPISECGLTLYPISMRDYEEYAQCKDALCLRLSSLPVRYVSLDYLSAVFALELDAIQSQLEGGDPFAAANAGIFYGAMRLFGLSLRIELTADTLNDCLYYRREEKGITIDHLEIEQEGNRVNLTPFQFSSQIRPLIAAQNQITLPDESDNSELIEAYEKKKQLKSKGFPLKIDAGDLIASVAFASGVREKDVRDWTVREFENRRRAIERDKRYMLYAQAELSGSVSFKEGNPAPSWCFDVLDDTLGTINYSELEKTLKSVAAQG